MDGTALSLGQEGSGKEKWGRYFLGSGLKQTAVFFLTKDGGGIFLISITKLFSTICIASARV